MEHCLYSRKLHRCAMTYLSRFNHALAGSLPCSWMRFTNSCCGDPCSLARCSRLYVLRYEWTSYFSWLAVCGFSLPLASRTMLGKCCIWTAVAEGQPPYSVRETYASRRHYCLLPRPWFWRNHHPKKPCVNAMWPSNLRRCARNLSTWSNPSWSPCYVSLRCKPQLLRKLRFYYKAMA